MLTAILAIVAAPFVARAESTEAARAEAKKHYDRAMGLNEDGQVAEAVIELKRAYEIAPHYAVLYNLGQAYITLAKPVDAVVALQRYLDEGGKAIKADRRAEVEKEIARQKTRIATLVVRGLPDGAVVTIDGDEVGKTPLTGSVRVGVGKHVVAATAVGYEAGEAKIEVAGEDSKMVELKLVAKAGQPVPAAPVAASTPAVAAPLETPAKTTPTLAPAARTPEAIPPAAPGSSFTSATSPTPAPGVNLPPKQGENATGSDLRIAGLLAAGLGAASIVTGGILWGETLDKTTDTRGLKEGASVCWIAGVALTGVGLLLVFGEEGASRSMALAAAVGPSFAGLSANGTW